MTADDRAQVLETVLLSAAQKLDGYAQGILDDGAIVETHQDVARRLKDITDELMAALNLRPAKDGARGD